MEKYYCTAKTARETLDKYGVAIIPDVLNTFECIHMEDLAWEWLTEISRDLKTPFDYKKPETFKSVAQELQASHGMLWQRYGIGQSEFLWYVRSHPAVVQVFQKLWGTCSLKTSFDGGSIQKAPEETGWGWYKQQYDWFHVDQCPGRLGFECVQGWVTARDVLEGDATLEFLEGSHKKFHLLKSPKTDDWYKLTKEDLENFSDCPRVSIRCPAGSLVLWDSRTVHQGIQPIQRRKKINDRIVAYVCMMPDTLTKTEQNKRRRAYEDGRTSSHWPKKCKLNSVAPQLRGKPMPLVAPCSKPLLEDLEESLI